MGFKPGHQKHGGRKKGTPNAATAPIAELCAAHNCNPIEILIEFCKPLEPGLSPEKMLERIGYRFQAAKELAQYLYPKRKALEISVADIPDDEFEHEVERRLSERRAPGKISER